MNAMNTRCLSLFVIKMKARKRFLLLFVAFLALIHFGFNRFHANNNKISENSDFYSNNDLKGKTRVSKQKPNSCRMSTCFDFTRCKDVAKNGLRVHIYPNNEFLKVSESFAKITEILKTSVYFESDPQKACLFMATLWDPLDRDPLSRDYQKPHSSMSSLSVLYGGVNHVLFNLYSGSWPHYDELDFNYNQLYGPIRQILQKAILIKASQSRDYYRPEFDVSLPLFARNHPKRGPPFVSQESGQQMNSYSRDKEMVKEVESKRKRNLLVFKGKRYIYGIGSETRNALHYLNNERDVLIVTTCKHGKKWKDWKDDKCDLDNNHYDKYDYQQLMSNSTFCLVPRGRRLGSYRFLESLQLGCIPVVLSNSWVLPFQEIIDWNKCVVSADERLLFQIPEILRTFSSDKISTMRQKCLQLYETHFSSVERIVVTSLLIIEKRIQRHVSDLYFSLALNNNHNLLTKTQLSIIELPVNRTNNHVTALIHVTKPDDVIDTQRLIQRVIQSFEEIIVFWCIGVSVPRFKSNKIRVIKECNKFIPVTIATDALFQMSPQSLVTTEEINFAFQVWTQFSNRIIGFVSRDHYYDDDKRQYEYSSKWTNHYSSVTLDSALYHKLYNNMFSLFVARNQFFNQSDNNCLDLAFVFLISHLTREGPIKVTQRKKIITKSDSWSDWLEKKICFERLQQLFSYLPLIESSVRFDPLLYKDLVSVKRKKYRKMETIFN